MPRPPTALILVGHGSTENPDSSEPTRSHVDALRKLGIFAEVVPAFWKEHPSMREVWHMVESHEIYVVPNFISEGYFTQEIIPRELGLDGPVTRRDGRTIRYCDPVGLHPSMTRLLLRRARETAPNVTPSECALLVVGHGTNLNTRSRAAIEEQVRIIRDEGPGYAEVLDVYMEEAPKVSDWHKITSAPHVLVLPFFISNGLHSDQDIPALLGLEEGEHPDSSTRREQLRRSPQTLHGRTLYYAEAIGTEPLMPDVILDQISSFDAAHPEDIPEDSPSPPYHLDSALAAWIREGRRQIGEICILPSDLGTSPYRLCHREDAAQVAAGNTTHLETSDSPEQAHRIAQFDDHGKYRPHPFAPSLRRGWLLYLDDTTSLRHALDYFYPAAVGMWHAHTNTPLSTLTLREKLDRQTGIYRAAQSLSDARALTMLRRCCHPNWGCQKNILWKIGADTPDISMLDPKVPGEETAPDPATTIPLICQEACNFVVAQARKEALKEAAAAE